MKRFALLTLLALCAGAAEARVYSLSPAQDLPLPTIGGEFNTPKVAIDGDSIIVLAERTGGRSALLYQRGANGTWALSRTLLDVDGGDILQSEVSMANGLAAVKLDATMHVFERSATGEWLESAVAGTPQPGPGLVVSGARILAGRRCSYDADVHEKSLGSGVWRVVARLTTGLGAADCNHVASLDLDGSVALIHGPGREAYEFRRASASSWPLAGTLSPPPQTAVDDGAYSLQGDTAVAPGGAVFRRTGGAWSFVNRVEPLNFANGWTAPFRTQLTGGVLHGIQTDGGINSTSFTALYRETAPGQFEQAAMLFGPASAETQAFSGGTAVVGSNDFGFVYLSVFNLPPPASPDKFVNDFEARDVTGFRQTPGSAFQLTFTGTTSTGASYVYRQASSAGESRAVFGGDWNTQQYVEADITPTAFDGNDRWFGLGLRYVDDGNFYYVTLRSSGRVQIKRMLNGVFTTLAEAALPISQFQKHNVRFFADADRLFVRVDGDFFLSATDSSFTHGSSALMTNRTLADFDNVFAGSTLPFSLHSKDFTDFRDPAFGLAQTGGQWTPVEGPDSELDGLAQTSTEGDARGVSGPSSTDDQRVEARIRLDQSGTSPSGTWFGVLARYVDARTHYYLSVRSTGQLQIRKQVNGVITVLATAPYTVAAGGFHDYALSVVGNELHAYVDDRFVAGALDDAIPRGRFGVGMYRTAVTIRRLDATQP